MRGWNLILHFNELIEFFIIDPFSVMDAFITVSSAVFK